MLRKHEMVMNWLQTRIEGQIQAKTESWHVHRMRGSYRLRLRRRERHWLEQLVLTEETHSSSDKQSETI